MGRIQHALGRRKKAQKTRPARPLERIPWFLILACQAAEPHGIQAVTIFCIFSFRTPSYPDKNAMTAGSSMVPEDGLQDQRSNRTIAVGTGLSGAAEFEAEALPHLNDLYRAAASILRSRAEAEDAVQEAYLQALKSFH